jgi:predicted phosphohydrolase
MKQFSSDFQGWTQSIPCKFWVCLKIIFKGLKIKYILYIMLKKVLKIKYMSDLHLEIVNPKKICRYLKQIKSDTDICILAGDIGKPKKDHYDKIMDFMNKNFKKTFVITGNHEYYGSSIEEIDDYLEEYFKKYENISFLNNKSEYYKGKYFIGSTMWSHIKDNGYFINDIRNINGMTIEKYNNLNKKCTNFIKKNIKDDAIVITHHMPSYTLTDPFYIKKYGVYNQWFYCDMDEFIKSNRIKYWIYGHTHIPNECSIENTKFLCNPIGYPGENQKVNFNREFKL